MLFVEDSSFLLSTSECMIFSLLFEKHGFVFDPFCNLKICKEGRGVRCNNPGDYLIPSMRSLSIYVKESFYREVSDCYIKDDGPGDGRVLIGSVKMCPPVVFCDQNVCHLQAVEALLLVARVLGKGVRQVLVKRCNGCCEDLEVVELIRA